jgi:hypothetical protein
VVGTGGLTVNGMLTLNQNDLIAQSGSWSSINGLAISGHLTLPGTNGGNTTLGIMPNNGGSGMTAIKPTFDSITVTYADILVKYTYVGDANLDGHVDGSDYSLIDNGYNNHLTGWYNGDFNYDGVVDGADYTLIDNQYNTDPNAPGL